MTPRKQITELTPTQHDRMHTFAQEFITNAYRTTPLTEEEWAVWETGARRCYEFADIEWPGVVIRVPSPIVGAFAAPIAAYVLAELRRDGVLPGSAVDSAVGSAVGSAVDSAVDSAVGSAVDSAVDSAVGAAVRSAGVSANRDALTVVQNRWYHTMDGRTGGGYSWWVWWRAYVAFFRDVIQLDLDTDLWDRSRALDAAASAGAWWPFRDFVMVCELPTTVNVETAAGTHRLHNETGPAIGWNGWGIYAWHGTQVPADLIETGWDTDRILRERNTEVRRAAIERMGWDQFITDAGLVQVGDAVPDPGNPGKDLTLYDVPARIFGDVDVRVLLCTNGTPERDGTIHRFGLTVPADITSPLAASAWTFGLAEDQYAGAQRRT